MDPEFKAIFFIAALLGLCIAGVLAKWTPTAWLAFGLAAFVVPFLWDAVEAA